MKINAADDLVGRGTTTVLLTVLCTDSDTDTVSYFPSTGPFRALAILKVLNKNNHLHFPRLPTTTGPSNETRNRRNRLELNGPEMRS